MHRQINITLPDEIIELIDQVIEKGDSPEETLRDRSGFINEAVQYYIAQKTLVNLRERLKEGAIQRAKRDLGLAEEWFDSDRTGRLSGRLEEGGWKMAVRNRVYTDKTHLRGLKRIYVACLWAIARVD